MDKLTLAQVEILKRYPTSYKLEREDINNASPGDRIRILCTQLADTMRENERLKAEINGAKSLFKASIDALDKAEEQPYKHTNAYSTNTEWRTPEPGEVVSLEKPYTGILANDPYDTKIESIKEPEKK